MTHESGHWLRLLRLILNMRVEGGRGDGLTWNAGMVLRIRAAVETMTNPIEMTAIT